ncbi:transferrin-binding protein-like solute binding protein [Sphingomonas pituitosa]|uniref:transferrin-binding protein-like solute binding protein n=1 Tax=Sphingomonas pituitosa TaxID=99597 RepID=UPI00082E9383|nr:transferrin-binding protein-like solute binding protein [Sphingomonas pituitosa]
MIRRYVILGSAAAAAALASCSGGGNSSSTPTPTPTPTSSPTPTPSPTPTYTAFPLAAATEFNTLNATTNYTGDPATGAVTLGVTATETFTNRVKLAATTDLTNGTFVMDEAVEESRFTGTNVVTTAAPTVTEFVYRSVSTATGAAAGNFSQLEVLNNIGARTTSTTTGVVTSDSLLSQLTVLSYANWWRGDSTAGQKRLTYSIWGYPTLSYDMPTTGSATYTARIVGRSVSVANSATTLNRVGGTATVTVNFATGLVTTTMNLTTVPTSGAETAYVTLNAQGAIPIGQNQFSGSFASGGFVTGTITGAFYGAKGVNIGVVFGASGTINGADTRIVGEVVGIKQQ